MQKNDLNIRTCACSSCVLCGTQGEELYSGLTDRLFGAPGTWNLKHCPNETCGLVWLDPKPMEEDIGLAYRQYYTHHGGRLKRNLKGKSFKLLQDFLAGITGLSKEQDAIQSRYLAAHQPGRLLEVGCGAGDYLVEMRNIGWDVQGVEIDPAACKFANVNNLLAVHEGTLFSAEYPEHAFDAIVLNHVLEHVHTPVLLLQECHRIVKPGGYLVVVTPNVESWGHTKFKENWRGLEPPRHIHIFSTKTMKKLGELAGFKKVSVSTTPANADGIIGASIALERENKKNQNIIDKIMSYSRIIWCQYLEYRLWKKDSHVGEEVVLICQK